MTAPGDGRRVPLRAVAFDVGETLMSEERAWGTWADWLGVSRFDLFAALGAAIASRAPHGDALRRVRGPDVDLAAEERARAAAGVPPHEALYDPYPDAAPALRALRAAGLRIAIAGNQPAGAVEAVRDLVEPGDVVGMSAAWGVAKPSAAFFSRLLDELGCAAEEIAYVGDRLDNDVVPAAEAGMVPVLLRRGPWAVAQDGWPEASRAEITVGSLEELVPLLVARAAPVS